MSARERRSANPDTRIKESKDQGKTGGERDEALENRHRLIGKRVEEKYTAAKNTAVATTKLRKLPPENTVPMLKGQDDPLL